MQTPWGESQSIERYDDGFFFASTASHGGYMLSRVFAGAFLSASAIKRAEFYGKYLAYEEDCAYAIPMFELRGYWSEIYPGRDALQQEGMLLRVLSRWNADYLLERGITPSSKEFRDWERMREDNRRRDAKDPDLIVSASRMDDQSDVCKVTTADGKEHFVTSESYAKRPPNELSLLSRCITLRERGSPSIMQLLTEAGVRLDSHESDLYAEKTAVSERILSTYHLRENVTEFVSQQDGKTWYDIPFAYDPFWNRVARAEDSDTAGERER